MMKRGNRDNWLGYRETLHLLLYITGDYTFFTITDTSIMYWIKFIYSPGYFYSLQSSINFD
jgi:hypothetical protein